MKLSPKKTVLLFTSIAAWAIVATVVIYSFKSVVYYLSHETTNDAQVSEYINPIIARVSGYITKVNFQDYEYVHKGDTLLIIDNKEYQLDEDQISSEAKKQRAIDQVLLQKIATLTDEALEAKQAIDAVKAKVWKQELEYKRYKELFEKKSATAQKLEDIEATLNIYRSELSTVEQHHRVAQSKIDDVNEERNIVKAELGRLSDIHARKRIDVGYTVITAPYNGRLGKRKIEQGQMISVGDPLGYIVNDENPKWVLANFKETQVQHIHLHDTVTVKADAYPEEVFSGKVIAFSPATGSSFSLLPPDNSTGNFVKIVQRIPVKIELFEDSIKSVRKLVAGMNVEVSIRH